MKPRHPKGEIGLIASAFSVACIGTLVYVAFAPDIEHDNPGVRHEQSETPAVPTQLSPPHPGEGGTVPDSRASSGEPRSWTEWSVQGQDIAVALADVDPGWLPTADGLWALTGEQWSNEEFAALPARDALLLIPPMAGYDHAAPGSLAELLGGFPARADCDRAVQSPSVRVLLEDVQWRELFIAEMEAAPEDSRSRAFIYALDRARMERDAANEGLMAELEKATSYKHWTLLWRLWKEWSK